MAEPTTDTANDSIDRRKDVDDEKLSSKFWLGEITAAHKRNSTWVERAEKVIARYRDERSSDRGEGSERRTNILWSNTETLKSALFQGLGKPDVRRRFQKQGQDDRISRQAALVLERGLAYCADAYDAESQIDAVVEDQLLPGRGTAWIVYEADVDDYGGAEDEKSVDPAAMDQPELAEPQAEPTQQPAAYAPVVTSQSVRFDHVYWRDFLTSAGRKWSDVWWAARGHDYSRDELTKYFPDHADEIPLNVEIAGYEAGVRKKSRKEDEDTFKRARVWEIWDKSKKQRVYVAEGYKFIMETNDDPYKLRDFFPTVEPLYGVKTTSSLEAIPEFTLYQDQAEELDVVQTRLVKLTSALKRRGVYDATLEGPDNQLSKLAFAGDNEFLPYRNMAVLMEKGGLANAFQAEDIKPMIEVIDKLGQRQMLLVQQIYEITGISDIMRGASDANETATAQRLKGQFGSMRLQKRQKKVQIFIRSLYRLKAEIMAEHFTREQLQEMTGIDMPLKAEQDMAKQGLAMLDMQKKQAQQMAQQGAGAVQGGAATPPPPEIDPKIMKRLVEAAKAVTWEEISGILRSDERRGYKVDIDTDALARIDDENEKSQRIEFMTAMQMFMEKTIPAINAFPALAPLAKETAAFAVGAFKVGRVMEESFEDTFQQLEDQAKAQMAKGPPQDPEEKKIAMDAKSREMDMQFKAKESEQDRQLKQAEFMHNSKMKETEFAHQSQLEERKAQLEERKMANAQLLAERKMDLDQQIKVAEFDHQRQMTEQKMLVDRERADWENHFKQAHAATTFDLEERKLGQEKELNSTKIDLEREKHSTAQSSARDSQNHELVRSMMQPEEKPDQQMLELVNALRETVAQQAQVVKAAMASKRLVKDPKTGEKRVEIIQ